MPNNVSCIVLTYNSQATLEKTLSGLAWADEIIVIDQGSTDQTLALAEKFSAKIFSQTSGDFSQRRNYGASKATNPWLFYVDADEVVSAQLRQEIIALTKKADAGAYSLTRVNYFLGTKMYPDTVTRLFHKTSLIRWEGEVHESALISGNLQSLSSPLIHHTHRSISSMLEKTNSWSTIQAQLLKNAHHPPVKVWRLVRIALTEWYRQFVVKRVGRYGKAGRIEGLFQIVDKVIVYIKLWELQSK